MGGWGKVGWVDIGGEVGDGEGELGGSRTVPLAGLVYVVGGFESGFVSWC